MKLLRDSLMITVSPALLLIPVAGLIVVGALAALLASLDGQVYADLDAQRLTALRALNALESEQRDLARRAAEVIGDQITAGDPDALMSALAPLFEDPVERIVVFDAAGRDVLSIVRGEDFAYRRAEMLDTSAWASVERLTLERGEMDRILGDFSPDTRTLYASAAAHDAGVFSGVVSVGVSLDDLWLRVAETTPAALALIDAGGMLLAGAETPPNDAFSRELSIAPHGAVVGTLVLALPAPLSPDLTRPALVIAPLAVMLIIGVLLPRPLISIAPKTALDVIPAAAAPTLPATPAYAVDLATFDHEPFDLVEVARSVTAQWQEYARARHIRLSIAAAPPLRVMGDALRMAQVVDYLLRNACGALTSPTSVGVAFDQVRGMARMVVVDNGVVDETADSALFTEKERQLGLYFARSIVERHQGELIIASRADIGTVVTVLLPQMPKAP